MCCMYVLYVFLIVEESWLVFLEMSSRVVEGYKLLKGCSFLFPESLQSNLR